MANVLNSKPGPEPEDETNHYRDEVPLLDEPRGGIPSVVSDATHLSETVAAFAAGSGPLAVDAERASGYRYGQRAYLVQMRREGAGTALIDPIACPDLSALGAIAATTETILHAAHQDLPCLSEIRMRPTRLFDTELAGRLLGYQRVGLGAMVERVLGMRLAKEHSAVDWSARPLPEGWLRYAALDVEVLIELREELATELAAAGKLDWAREEFAAILAAPPKEPRPDPWRRTSGIHRVRSQRGLAAVRELWQERDRIARECDLSPGRVVADSGIVEAATALPRSPRELMGIKAFNARTARRYLSTWLKALSRARSMSDTRLPQPATAGDGPPPTNRWADRDPEAARRLEAVRGVVNAVASEVVVPAENLVAPDTVRRLAWSPPTKPDERSVAEQLRSNNAREWQIGLTARRLAEALRAA